MNKEMLNGNPEVTKNTEVNESDEMTDAFSSDRHIVHIINPVSGSGRKFRKTRDSINAMREDIYLTKREGDCKEFVANLLAKDPYAHIVAHGGDGTMGETICGIMNSGANKTALFTGVPSGSGNDFLHYMYDTYGVYGKAYPIDVMKSNNRYAVNVINIGFDCTVVSEAERIRKMPLMSGPFSYIAGVATTLVKKESFSTTLRFEDIYDFSTGKEYNEDIENDFLLIAIANARYYGGGFMAAPLAEVDDGYLDVVVAKNVSVPAFISLVSDYKKGSHLSRETNRVKDQFRGVLYYRRCRKISFDGIKEISFDGDIEKSESITVECMKHAVLYAPPKESWIKPSTK